MGRIAVPHMRTVLGQEDIGCQQKQAVAMILDLLAGRCQKQLGACTSNEIAFKWPTTHHCVVAGEYGLQSVR